MSTLGRFGMISRRVLNLAAIVLVCQPGSLSAQQAELVQPTGAPDWLIDASPYQARITVSDQTVVLENGLVRRTITRVPGAATVGLDNLLTGASMVRAVEPEAIISVSRLVLSPAGSDL